MKRISILVMAALAALALTAAVGSASASASTVLCGKDVRPCAAGDVLSAGTPIFYANSGALGGDALDVNVGSLNFNCDGISLGGVSTAASGSKLPLEGMGKLFECQIGSGPRCSVNQVDNIPATLEWLGGVAAIKFGSASEHFTVTFNCTLKGEEIKCTFSHQQPYPLTMVIFYNKAEGHWEGSIEEETMTAQPGGDQAFCPAGKAAGLEASAPYQAHWNVFPSWTP